MLKCAVAQAHRSGSHGQVGSQCHEPRVSSRVHRVKDNGNFQTKQNVKKHYYKKRRLKCLVESPVVETGRRCGAIDPALSAEVTCLGKSLVAETGRPRAFEDRRPASMVDVSHWVVWPRSRAIKRWKSYYVQLVTLGT